MNASTASASSPSDRRGHRPRSSITESLAFWADWAIGDDAGIFGIALFGARQDVEFGARFPI
jgi:hypothetical protein